MGVRFAVQPEQAWQPESRRIQNSAFFMHLLFLYAWYRSFLGTASYNVSSLRPQQSQDLLPLSSQGPK